MKANGKDTREAYPAAPPPDELAARVAAELQAIMREAFGPVDNLKALSGDERRKGAKAAAEFARAAATILTDIFSRELRGEISEVRRLELVNAFVRACIAKGERHHIAHDAIERLGRDIGKAHAQKARSAKEADSRNTDAIIGHHAHETWKKKPKLRGNALGTANAIADAVNAGRAANGLKRLGVDAIRKRVVHILTGTTT